MTSSFAAAVGAARENRSSRTLLASTSQQSAARFVLPISNQENFAIHGEAMPPLLQGIPHSS